MLLTRSPIEIMPISFFPSNTGRWRTRFSPRRPRKRSFALRRRESASQGASVPPVHARRRLRRRTRLERNAACEACLSSSSPTRKTANTWQPTNRHHLLTLLNGSGLDPGQGFRRKVNAASRAHAWGGRCKRSARLVGSVEELRLLPGRRVTTSPHDGNRAA